MWKPGAMLVAHGVYSVHPFICLASQILALHVLTTHKAFCVDLPYICIAVHT